MKREKWLTGLIAACLAWMLAFGSIGSFIDGFCLETPGLAWLALICAAAAVCAAAVFQFRFGGLTAVVGIAVLLIVIWEPAQLQCKTLIWMISTLYHMAYGWPEVRFGLESYEGMVFSYPLILMAVLIAVCVAWTVCCRRRSVVAVVVGLLPLAASLLVWDTMPDDRLCLFFLLLGQMLLVLTGTVRRNSAHQGNRLAAVALIPSALLLGCLFWAIPQKSYTEQASQLRSRVYGWAQRMALEGADVTGFINTTLDGVNQEKVNLDKVGPKVQQTYKVMEVTAPISQLLYLRGQDYDVYNGGQWNATEEREELFSAVSPLLSDTTSAGTLHITTVERQPVYFMPYEVMDTVTLEGGKLPNQEKLRTYSFNLLDTGKSGVITYSMITDNGEIDSYLTKEEQVLAEQYCALPEETRQWVQEQILPQLDLDGLLPSEQAERIGQFVRQSALYSLDTPRMSADETDFVCWFLEESDTGYCVHFASAATVLLRAAGIPARFVEGYTVQVEAGEPAAVTQDMAHSWAEYYNAITDRWVILDATPVDLAVFSPEEVQQEEIAVQPQTQPSDVPEQVPSEELSVPGYTAAETFPLDWLWKIVKWICLGISVVMLICGQRMLRLQLRRYRKDMASPNARALLLWRETVRLGRSLEEDPPKQLFELAQKAKFSQHTLTEDELSQFDDYQGVCIRVLRQRPWYRRVPDQFLFAYY